MLLSLKQLWVISLLGGKSWPLQPTLRTFYEQTLPTGVITWKPREKAPSNTASHSHSLCWVELNWYFHLMVFSCFWDAWSESCVQIFLGLCGTLSSGFPLHQAQLLAPPQRHSVEWSSWSTLKVALFWILSSCLEQWDKHNFNPHFLCTH